MDISRELTILTYLISVLFYTQYLELRYNSRAVRILGSILGILNQVRRQFTTLQKTPIFWLINFDKLSSLQDYKYTICIMISLILPENISRVFFLAWIHGQVCQHPLVGCGFSLGTIPGFLPHYINCCPPWNILEYDVKHQSNNNEIFARIRPKFIHKFPHSYVPYQLTSVICVECCIGRISSGIYHKVHFSDLGTVVLMSIANLNWVIHEHRINPGSGHIWPRLEKGELLLSRLVFSIERKVQRLFSHFTEKLLSMTLKVWSALPLTIMITFILRM